MKILQTLKYYYPSKGGTESVVKNLINELIKMGTNISFTVFTNNHDTSFKFHEYYYPQLKILKVPTQFFLRSQPLTFRYNKLAKEILQSDVIHHHYPFPNMELALLRNLKNLAGKKFIITWHANIRNSRWSWIEKFYNPIINRLLERADFIVVTSPQLIEESEILKKYKDKLRVIPLSFDPIFASLKCKEFPSEKEFEILFVGKLRKYKGIEFLIKAIQYLPVKLTIVGDGEELEFLQKLAIILDIKDKIKFITEATDENLIGIYRKSNLFVLPSINEAEAFGVVQLEAMANGLPVINTKLNSGVPYVSLNGYSGLTVNPSSVEELKKAIEEIINNKELYEKFSSNSIERSKIFSRKVMAESYLNLYNF